MIAALIAPIMLATMSGPAPAPAPELNLLIADAQPKGQAIQRVYDLRDLSAILDEGRLEDIVIRMAEAVGAHGEPLDAGLFIVQAEQDTLDSFDSLLESVRALYARSYTLEVRVSQIDLDDAPAIGDPLPEGAKTLLLTRQGATRRVATSVQSLLYQSYVSDVQPVVSDSAVGYDPTIAEISSGLSASVVVGAGPEDAQSTLVTIRGSLVRGAITNVKLHAETGNPVQELPDVALPTRQERTLNATTRVQFGQPITACVVAGFEDGTASVVSIVVWSR